MFFGGKIKNLQTQISEGTKKSTELASKETILWKEIGELRNKFLSVTHKAFNKQIFDNAYQSNNVFEKLPPYNIPGWKIDNWKDWNPKEADLQSLLYFGRLVEQNPSIDLAYNATSIIPFFGKHQSYFIESSRDDNNAVYSFFQSLALRIYARLLHNVSFSFIDPSGFGKAFPIAKQLNTRLDSGDLFRLLEDIGKDITRINQTYGLSDDKMFDSIADTILINEKFEIIFVANFPKDYDRRVIERLLKIADQGPIAGKYVIFHHNTDEEMPRDINLESVTNAVKISTDSGGFVWTLKDKTQSIPLDWALDEKPSDEAVEFVVKKIKDSIPKENPIDWNVIKSSGQWKDSSIEYIEASVGVSGSKTPLNIWFGRKHNEGSRQCVHGILAGMPGSGKSNFYHALILGLASKYDPKEVGLYLIDGKDGVEFQDYKNLPHAEFVSLKSLPSLSRSILKDLTEEIERRNEMFKEQHSVDNYENYRKKVGNKSSLPRILLVVDEYQELFEGDNLGEASNYLRRISEEGRSAGIHMLLGSQRFGTVNMMHQSAIFGNIHMRIAMKLSLADRQALTEFGKEGKDFLANCDLPGKVVVNDQSGDDGYNKLGKVALIKKEDRQEAIADIIRRANESDIPKELLTTNIFNGVEQPFIFDNPQFGYFLKAEKKFSKNEIEEFARKAIYNGGLGEVGWFSGETPFVYWLGQEFNVRGHANIITRRRQRENVLIIGDNNDARYGMMFGILSSAVLNAPKNEIEFFIADKSIPGTPWSNVLSQVSKQIIETKNYKQKFASKSDEISSILSHLNDEIAKRKTVAEDDRQNLSTIIFVASDLDRIDNLNLQLNKYGTLEETETGKLLRQVIIEGPALGIHSFLSFEGVMPMYNVISKKNLEFFRHRVALQMSEQDAFDLVRRRDASRLQNHGTKPIASFYLDIGSNKTSTFKPYIVSKGISNELIQEIVKGQS
jgi:S-DNA-T family DNA segregation ATPase FtsK/SpoIIIE